MSGNTPSQNSKNILPSQEVIETLREYINLYARVKEAPDTEFSIDVRIQSTVSGKDQILTFSPKTTPDLVEEVMNTIRAQLRAAIDIHKLNLLEALDDEGTKTGFEEASKKERVGAN